MATEAYFRIPEEFRREEHRLEETLKKVALIFAGAGSIVSKSGIASEGDSNDKMKLEGSSMMYQRDSGYKYQVGSSNDLKMDVVDKSRGIYLIAYRYGKDEQMQNMSRGICEILRLDYMYNTSFELKIQNEVHPLIQEQAEKDGLTVYRAQDEIYKSSREFIKDALYEHKIFEKDLTKVENQDIIVKSIISRIKG